MKSFGKILSLRTHSLVLLLLLIASYERIFVPSKALAPVELDVLLGLKEVWNDPDQVLSSWTQDSDYCQSQEISCDENGYINELNIYGTRLSGPLPSSIGNLTQISSLYLDGNNFSGPIPSSIGKLTNLNKLKLSNNQFSEPIPSSIGNLTNLNTLDLSRNKFSGPIPSSIGKLTNLNKLDLSRNKFSGPIPSSIGKLTNLNKLDLSRNIFSGPIPSTIGKLTNLKTLRLSNNQFSGLIPSSVGKLTNLRILLLSNNQLSGSIPASIGLLSATIDLSYNYFTENPIDCVYRCSILDMSQNCLKNASYTQRNNSECSSFCGANSATGPCGGHGTCTFNASKIPVCTCDYGWADCQPVEESSNGKLVLIIGITAAIALFLIIFAIFACVLFKKYKKKEFTYGNVNENANANEPNAMNPMEKQNENA